MKTALPVSSPEIEALLRRLPKGPAELFERYRYRDPSRVCDERMAELRVIDLDLCAACKADGWPCPQHRAPGCPRWPCREHRPDGADMELAG